MRTPARRARRRRRRPGPARRKAYKSASQERYSLFVIMETKWIAPFRVLLGGPSGCGKTVFVKKFIKFRKQLCDVEFSRIIFFYSENQPTYTEFDSCVEFCEGLPHPSDFADDPSPKLIIIDDFMRESANNVIIDLFTKGSHHKNISIIFISQNIFYKSQRDLSLNVSYLVVFKNPRDRAQVQHLARQLWPENVKFIREIFKDATSKPHSYLLFDLTQKTPDDLRFRACIFPNETNYVYIPKRKL